MVVKRSVQGTCLNLFTVAAWEQESEKVLEGLDIELNPEHAAFWSKYNAGVHYVTPDGKLSRLNIPSDLWPGQAPWGMMDLEIRDNHDERI